MSEIISDQKVHFPIFEKRPFAAYLDSAATTLKHRDVLQKVDDYNKSYSANIHRGLYAISEKASSEYEQARSIVQKFINAKQPEEIIFTKGTTESINLVAQSYGETFLKEGDAIVLSTMEHHSNIIPWQILAKKKNLTLKYWTMTPQGDLNWGQGESLFTSDVKLVAITGISNTLGTINPLQRIATMAHNVGAKILIDGAQMIAHEEVNVQKIDADFFVFSGHKCFAPTGIGVLYGKKELLDKMPPYQAGGGMIELVDFQKSTYAPVPAKFEAGTPPVASALGLGMALTYIKELGPKNISAYEESLMNFAQDELSKIEGLKIIGNASRKSSIISFVHSEIHPHDLATFLDQEGVCVRTGHHCSQLIMKHFNIPATVRASLSVYNDQKDVDLLVASLKKTLNFFNVM